MPPAPGMEGRLARSHEEALVRGGLRGARAETDQRRFGRLLTGAPYRILFESRPLFQVIPGARDRAVMEGHEGVRFVWVRE